MKMKRNAVILGLACIVTANTAGLRAQPASGDKVKDDVKQAVNDTQTYVGEKKVDYEKRIRADLDDLDAKIDQLKKKISGLSKEGNAKAKAQVRELKKKRVAAGKKFGRVKAASEKEWVKFKAGVDDALSDLKKACEDFKAKMN